MLYRIKVIALGGFGEIGMNLMLFETDEEILVIDCGIMFPEDYMLGIDLVLPDFSYLIKNKDKVKGFFLTHGHEDHFGALPYVLSKVNAPVYGSALTIGFVREKLEEFKLSRKVRLETVRAGDELRIGSFELELIQVSHSIADGLAFALRTPLGKIVHSGDFKIDPTPVDGKRMDLNSFARLGEEGVLALFSDSTNVEREGFTPSEREVGKVMFEIFQEALGRIIVAVFASHIPRIQQVIEVSKALNKKILVHGYSMEANTRIAEELGYLNFPKGVRITLEELEKFPPQKLVILTTGSQGEPLSALARMARGEHKKLEIKKGDTVILSSKFIPGNEKTIDNLINELYRRGAEVFYEKVSEIHVSGHASREELKLLLSLTQPKYFIPIHGEYRHLVKHIQLAEEMGIPKERCILAEDGDIIEFDKEGARISGRIDVEPWLVDGKLVGDISNEIIRERNQLGKDGVMVINLAMDTKSAKRLTPIFIKTKGIIFEDQGKSLIEELRKKLEQTIDHLSPQEKDKNNLEEILAQETRRFFKKTIMRRPTVICSVLEL